MSAPAAGDAQAGKPQMAAVQANCSAGRRHALIRGRHMNRGLSQFTASVTVAAVVLLGAAPFWSAPVRVNVYVFAGVTVPLLVLLLLLDEPQAGSRIKLAATAISEIAPSMVFLRVAVAPTPASNNPGTVSHRA